jgi:hypothetical protein
MQKASTSGKNASNTPDLVDEASVKQMCDMGFSDAAARLALGKSRGKLSVACNWLFDDANLPEIEAAEAADIDGIIEWFRARSVSAEETGSEEMPERDDAEEMPEPDASCSRLSVSEEREPPISTEVRRQSLQSDDGCGLGRFLNRQSFPSPRQVPLPGRLSRGTCDSARRSSTSSTGSRASIASEGECAELERSSDFGRPSSVCSNYSRDESKNVLPPAAASQEVVVNGSCGETSDSKPQSPRALLPPDSTCWDWPLSRHEKKTRLQMIERHILAMDRKSLLKEVDELRKSSRISDSSSTDGAATRLSA